MGSFTDWDAWEDDEPEPPSTYARFDPTNRQHAILLEVIAALRLFGVVLALGGGLIAGGLVINLGPMSTRAALVTGLVVVPGVLYLVASIGLTRRRYWAWVMSFIVTSLLIMVLLVLCVAVVLFRDEWMALLAWIPLALYISMPGLVLWYMIRALPVVRDAELLIRTGFSVLPKARDAEENLPPPQTVLLRPAGEGHSPDTESAMVAPFTGE